MTSHCDNIEVLANIRSFIQRAQNQQVVKEIKNLIKWLLKEQIAYKMRILPGMVGVHKSNRDGILVNGHDVHFLLSALYDIGFDPDEPDPVAV